MDKVCRCGAKLHISKFRDVQRQMTDLCPKCRNRKRSLERYHQKRKKDLEEQARRDARVAVLKRRDVLDDPYTNGMFREIRNLRARPARRVRVLQDKLNAGRQSPRTLDRIKRQQEKVAYYEDIERIMRIDLKHDNLKPVDFYLANTYLLYKHGYNVVVTDTDPEVQYE